MKNATYDAATGSIVPEQRGADFDVSAAQAALDAAEPGETVTVPATIEYPTVTAENLKAVLFRDVLGSATTHVGGTSARISNVKLSAGTINGTVLNHGDVFSYNGTVGQRTAARGYQAAPAYVQGETVDEIGGGICQTSSTLYYACLLSNLEITERYAHRYIPAYIMAGVDATVSWGGPDYKFTNDTDYPIKIVTSYANNYLTVKILGTKTDDITVKMTNEQLSTTPYEVIEQEDNTLAPGTQTVKTTPYTGYKYKTYRNLYDGNGNLISTTYEDTSDYKSRNKVVLVGPKVTTPETSTATGGTTSSASPSTTPSATPSTDQTQTGNNTSTDTPVDDTPDTSTEGNTTIVVIDLPGSDA
jgi:vancomycin resistance protein YoaR